MDSFYDRVIDDKKALAELRKLVRPILVQPDTSGNWDRNKERVVLGCMAGPLMEVDNAIHELGHLLLASDENANRNSWGLGYKKWVDCTYSRMGGYYEVNTAQDVILEAKVWTAQVVLRQKIGYSNEPIAELVASASFLAGFCNVPASAKATEDDDYDSKRILTIVEWVENNLQQKAFSLESLLAELKRKKKVVNQKLAEMAEAA